MDVFTLVVLVMILGGVLFFVAVGFASRNRPVAEFLDKKANERWAAQAVIEERSTGQMLEGNNRYRRKRGEEDLTLEDLQAAANRRQRASIEQAEQSRTGGSGAASSSSPTRSAGRQSAASRNSSM